MKNNNKNKLNNKKFITIIVVLCILILAAVGALVYLLVQNAKAEQLAKEKEEQMIVYEQKLNEAIEKTTAICPEILEYAGEDEISYSYFISNINSSDNIYEKATNANSLLKATAFYFDQFTAIGLEDIENGKDVSVYYTAETNDYRTQLTSLRNDFTKNWYGFLGKSDLSLLDSDEETETESE